MAFIRTRPQGHTASCAEFSEVPVRNLVGSSLKAVCFKGFGFKCFFSAGLGF